MKEINKEYQEQLKGLSKKVEAFAKTIGALAKDGENTNSHYTYLTNETTMAVLRDGLHDANIGVFTKVVDIDEKEGLTSGGKNMMRTVVKMKFKVVDLETGFFQNQTFFGAEQDTGGKSLQQAITQCTKYFYFKLFKISTADEVDGDGRTVKLDKTKTKSAKPSNNGGGSASDDDDDNKPWLNIGKGKWNEIVLWVAQGNEIGGVRNKYKVSKKSMAELEIQVEAKKKAIKESVN